MYIFPYQSSQFNSILCIVTYCCRSHSSIIKGYLCTIQGYLCIIQGYLCTIHPSKFRILRNHSQLTVDIIIILAVRCSPFFHVPKPSSRSLVYSICQFPCHSNNFIQTQSFFTVNASHFLYALTKHTLQSPVKLMPVNVLRTTSIYIPPFSVESFHKCLSVNFLELYIIQSIIDWTHVFSYLKYYAHNFTFTHSTHYFIILHTLITI